MLLPTRISARNRATARPRLSRAPNGRRMPPLSIYDEAKHRAGAALRGSALWSRSVGSIFMHRHGRWLLHPRREHREEKRRPNPHTPWGSRRNGYKYGAKATQHAHTVSTIAIIRATTARRAGAARHHSLPRLTSRSRRPLIYTRISCICVGLCDRIKVRLSCVQRPITHQACDAYIFSPNCAAGAGEWHQHPRLARPDQGGERQPSCLCRPARRRRARRVLRARPRERLLREA